MEVEVRSFEGLSVNGRSTGYGVWSQFADTVKVHRRTRQIRAKYFDEKCLTLH